LRTAKSCGPDLPTLGSSLKSLQATVANKPGTPGRTRISRKTTRAGNAGSFRRTCGDLLACFSLLHARLRVRSCIRHSLRPLYFMRGEDDASLGHFVPRECEVALVVVARMSVATSGESTPYRFAHAGYFSFLAMPTLWLFEIRIDSARGVAAARSTGPTSLLR
jgi:hypothetical protein